MSTKFKARQEWDERYADLVLGKHNCQIAAAGLSLPSLILAGDIVWLSNRSRYIPYVVEVDKFGYASRRANAEANCAKTSTIATVEGAFPHAPLTVS